jgi:hypothetical protein
MKSQSDKLKCNREGESQGFDQNAIKNIMGVTKGAVCKA